MTKTTNTDTKKTPRTKKIGIKKINRCRFILSWENKWSHDTGYVGKIKTSNFENTPDIGSARTFPSTKAAENAIRKLMDMGEADNNLFYVVAI